MPVLPNDVLGQILLWIIDTSDICTINQVCHQWRNSLQTSLTFIGSSQKKPIPSHWLRRYINLQHITIPVDVTCQDDLIRLSHLETCYFVLKNNIEETMFIFSQHYNRRGIFSIGTLEKGTYYPMMNLSPDRLAILVDTDRNLHKIVTLFPRKEVIACEICLLPPEVEEFKYILPPCDGIGIEPRVTQIFHVMTAIKEQQIKKIKIVCSDEVDIECIKQCKIHLPNMGFVEYLLDSHLKTM